MKDLLFILNEHKENWYKIYKLSLYDCLLFHIFFNIHMIL